MNEVSERFYSRARAAHVSAADNFVITKISKPCFFFLRMNNVHDKIESDDVIHAEHPRSSVALCHTSLYFALLFHVLIHFGLALESTDINPGGLRSEPYLAGIAGMLRLPFASVILRSRRSGVSEHGSRVLWRKSSHHHSSRLFAGKQR